MTIEMELNKIYNEDCLETMKAHIDEKSVDLVLTSPPYNISRAGSVLEASGDTYPSTRYDGFNDTRTAEEYIEWTIGIFRGFERVLKPNGCILYNMSYATDVQFQSSMMYLVIAEIVKRTEFTVADTIVWKKRSAVPNNKSRNKLTRICEFVYVFCRKSEYETFKSAKENLGPDKSGQTVYGNVMNFLEAPNIDGCTDIHKATYSTSLCRKLLKIYAEEGGTIYDPFMGTGTTAIASIDHKCNYIGSEISKRYCDYAGGRVAIRMSEPTLF